jgi:hypothetical protein
LAVGGRLSNLQGQEDVEGRRSERRRQVPLGRHTALDRGQVRSLGFESGEHQLLPGGALFFPWSPLGRQVFVVVVVNSHRNGRRAKSGSPTIIDLGPNQEKDQKVGVPAHLEGCPLVEVAAPTLDLYQRDAPVTI